MSSIQLVPVISNDGGDTSPNFTDDGFLTIKIKPKSGLLQKKTDFW